MARSYTVKEAAYILKSGTDFECIGDISRRFPLFAHRMTECIAKSSEAAEGIIEMLPEYVTPQKMNKILKESFAPVESDIEDDNDEERHIEAEDGEIDYSTLKAGKLREILNERGLLEKCKEVMGKINHPNMVKFLTDVDNGTVDNEVKVDEPEAKELETEDVPEHVDAESTEVSTEYDGKTAPELFKECKKRGIKVEPKKVAKFYVDVLVADDEAKAKAEADGSNDDDDDWDVESEAVSPKSEVEEEDDDWDI